MMPELWSESAPEGAGFVLWREMRRTPCRLSSDLRGTPARLTAAFGVLGVALIAFSLVAIQHRHREAPVLLPRVAAPVRGDASLRQRVSDLIYEVQLAERVDFVPRFAPRVKELTEEVERAPARHRQLHESLSFLRRGVEERSPGRREECYRKARLACERDTSQ